MKKLYEFIMNDGSKRKILGKDYGTHVSIKEINEDDDIDCIFGKTILVTNKPSTIEEEVQYCINNRYTYSSMKVEECILLEEK